MRLWAYRLLAFAPTLTLLLSLIWVWQTNPFIDPLVERSQSDLKRVLDRAVARTVDRAWLDQRLTDALTDDDLDRAALLITIGADQTPPVTPSPDLWVLYSLQAEQAASLWSKSRRCARCALDATTCKSIREIAVCLIPLELTPLGDINALRAEAWTAFSGGEVDTLNLGLATLGLGATVVIVASGPVSASAKIGATTLRVARKLGTLSARFSGELATLSRLDVKAWPLIRYATGRGPLDEALDVSRLRQLGHISDSMTTVARNTSAAEALVLLRHVDSAEDAARLARVAQTAGPDTRRYFAALGKSRVFRALVRISDTALAAAMLIYATVVHLLVALAQILGGQAVRLITAAVRPA